MHFSFGSLVFAFVSLFVTPIVLPDAEIILDPDTNVLSCSVESIMASTNPQTNVVYSWILGSNTGTGLSFEVTEPGQLILVAYDEVLDCTNSTTITILENTDEPNISILEPSPINCFNGSVEIDGSFSAASPNITFQWLDDDGQIIPGATNPLLDNVSQEGTYYLTAIDTENGCESIDSVELISDLNPPMIDAGADFILPCSPQQGSVLGSMDIAESNAEISWTNEAGDVIAANFLNAEILEPGMYFFNVSSTINGCSSIDSLEVGVAELGEVLFESNVPDCPGDENGFISIDVSGTQNPPVNVNFQGEDVGLMTEFSSLTAGTYAITVSDAFNCSLDTNYVITSANDFSLSLGDDQMVDFNEEVPLLADTDAVGAGFMWSPVDGLSCVDCPDPIATASTSITYTVVVTDENGCTKEASISLTVDTSNSVGIFVPNVFAPNEGNENGFFYIQGNAAVFLIEEFAIFDRWGNQVFSANDIQPNDPNAGWDGTFNGEELLAGVYSYYAKLSVLDGLRTIKGDITLIR